MIKIKTVISFVLVLGLLGGSASASKAGFDIGFSYPTDFERGTIKVDKGMAVCIPQPVMGKSSYDYMVEYVSSNPDSRKWKLDTIGEIGKNQMRGYVIASFDTFIIEKDMDIATLAKNRYDEYNNLAGTGEQENPYLTVTDSDYAGNEAFYYCRASWRDGDDITYKDKSEIEVWYYVNSGPQVLHIKLESAYHSYNGNDYGEKDRINEIHSYVSDFIGTKVMFIGDNTEVVEPVLEEQ